MYAESTLEKNKDQFEKYMEVFSNEALYLQLKDCRL